jgi:DNA polymerase III subunit delta
MSFTLPDHPIILVSSSEPLLIRDWLDQARAHLRKSGIEDIQTIGGDTSIDWNDLLMEGDSLSLFADQKCRVVHVNNGKPGQQGSKALIQLAENPPELTRIILVFPALDKSAKNSAWFKKVAAVGSIVEIASIYANRLVDWISSRAAGKSLGIDVQAAAFLAERTEGNLLAADQELEKLSIRLGVDGYISLSLVEDSTAESARYHHYLLLDSCLLGNAKRAMRILNSLSGEGVSSVQIRWSIQSTLDLLVKLKHGQSTGGLNDRLWQSLRIWQSKKQMYQKALGRLSIDKIETLIGDCARLDRLGKGQELQGFDAADWLQLKALISEFCGIKSGISFNLKS